MLQNLYRKRDTARRYSKRQFDGLIRAWRRRLHEWDPPKDEPGAAVLPAVAAPAAAPAPAPAPATPTKRAAKNDDDDFGPDLFAAAPASPGFFLDYGAAAPAAAAALAAPAGDELSDDEML